mgnify:CR=1 FL=1
MCVEWGANLAACDGGMRLLRGCACDWSRLQYVGVVAQGLADCLGAFIFCTFSDSYRVLEGSCAASRLRTGRRIKYGGPWCDQGARVHRHMHPWSVS